MRQVYYINREGFRLDLYDLEHVVVLEMDGVSGTAAINTASTAGFDGATVVSSQMPMRAISMVLLMDSPEDKLAVQRIFAPKSQGTLYYDDGGGVAKKIGCYVEACTIPPLGYPIKGQISLLCPQPYFESLDTISSVLAAIIPMWRFPFTIPREGMMFSRKSDSVIVDVPNNSEVDVGMTVVFYANSALSNPSIMNLSTGELLRLDTEMLAGDTITVTTHRGNKRITRTRGGVSDNLFNALSPGSVFLQLHQGNNPIRYNADSNLGGLELTIYHTDYYAGV